MRTEFDGISEFISRRGRIRFLEMLVQEFGSRSKVSNALKISKSTLSGWLNDRSRHPSNSSMRRVLDIARKVNLKGARKILDDESNAFDREIAAFVRRGANPQTNKS